MTYNYDFDISAVIICLFMLFYLIANKGLKRRQNKVFLMLTMAVLLSAAFDIASSISINDPSSAFGAYQTVLAMGYLFFHAITAWLFAMYIVYVFNLHHRLKESNFVLISLPMVIDLILIVTSPVTQFYFYFDENGVYSYGGGLPVMYLIPILYMVAAIVCTFMFRKALSHAQMISLFVLTIFTASSVLIQRLFPPVLIEVFCQSLGALGILITTESETEFYNTHTRVFNRYSFVTNLENLLVTGTRCGALVMKVPNISYYSASLGVKALYDVLAEITTWLKKNVPRTTIYDCENGHFVLMLYKDQIAEAEAIEQKILARFDGDWKQGSDAIRFPVQMTYLDIPGQADETEQIMRMVDTGYNTRESRSEIVSAERFNTYRRSVEVEHAIDRAIRDRSFQVYYQPIIHTIADEVTSAEALLRLTDPYLGNIGPEEFIPIAEKNGSIIEIGDFVFDEVCRFYAENHLDEAGIRYIEVNLSTLQCMDPTLAQRFMSTLERHGIAASKINLEITETAAASNPDILVALMHECREMGMSFSLDDFGTGYSNLSRTLRMPFSMIKLDKSLLWDAESDRNVRVIMTNMMRIFRELGMEILAEGIETIAQKKLLEQLGCDYMQGFLYARPMNGEDFLRFIRRKHEEAG